MSKLIDKLPAALANRLRTRLGRQFSRFVLVAIASLAVSEIALFLFGAMGLGGGTSGVAAAALGALVSYVLSRWAWRRKGRPNLRRETIPFWVVSVGSWLVLGLATKLGHHIAASMGAHGLKWYAIVGGVYFLANCVTFMIRFLIFHYVLFADRGADGGPAGLIETESLSPVSVTVPPATGEPDQPRK